jgi:hypothetical protein
MGKYHPSFCIQWIHTVFLLDYSQYLTRAIQKIKFEATSLNLQRDEGGDNSPTHINQKPNAFPGRPIADEKHIQSSRLPAYANAYAIEVATAVFLDSIFKRDHRIDHARPAIDAATAPDDSTILRESITLHPSRDTTAPCRGDSTTPTQRKHTAPPQHHRHPLSAPKTMPPTGRTALRAAIVRSRRPG